MIENDGKPVEYRLFTYENEENGWTVRAIFNPESEEFAIRTDIGMLEFALIEFITDSFELFRSMVEERLARIIYDDYVERSRNFSVILKNKGVPDVQWDAFLPEQLVLGGVQVFECLFQAVRFLLNLILLLSDLRGSLLHDAL